MKNDYGFMVTVYVKYDNVRNDGGDKTRKPAETFNSFFVQVDILEETRFFLYKASYTYIHISDLMDNR